MPIAVRTSDSVSSAIARARAQPSRSTCRAYSGSAASSARRARIGANRSLTASVDHPLERRRAAVADLVGDRHRVAVEAERRQQHQRGDLGPGGRVIADAPDRVGLRPPDQGGRLVGGGAQLDRVPARLAHLPAVGAEQQRRIRQERVRHREDRNAARPGIALVEPAGDQPGHLHVRQLILPDRHQVRLAGQDVGRLVGRVGEHQPAHRRLPGIGDLVLHGRVALQLGHRDQRQERQQELVQLRHRAVREDHRAAGVDPDRQVVEHQPDDVLVQVVGGVPVGQHLVVGDQHHHLGPGVLQPHPVPERAEVVPEVQMPGRPVAGQDPELPGVGPDHRLELGRSAERGGQGAGRGFGQRGCHGSASLAGSSYLGPGTTRASKNGRPRSRRTAVVV